MLPGYAHYVRHKMPQTVVPQKTSKNVIILWFDGPLWVKKKLVTKILYGCQVPSILQIVNKKSSSKKYFVSNKYFRWKNVFQIFDLFGFFQISDLFHISKLFWTKKIINISRFDLRFLEDFRFSKEWVNNQGFDIDWVIDIIRNRVSKGNITLGINMGVIYRYILHV